jgi:hypothetical protein
MEHMLGASLQMADKIIISRYGRPCGSRRFSILRRQ